MILMHRSHYADHCGWQQTLKYTLTPTTTAKRFTSLEKVQQNPIFGGNSGIKFKKICWFDLFKFFRKNILFWRKYWSKHEELLLFFMLLTVPNVIYRVWLGTKIPSLEIHPNLSHWQCDSKGLRLEGEMWRSNTF